MKTNDKIEFRYALNQFQEDVHATACANGFHDVQHDATFFAASLALIHGEVSEALEVVRKDATAKDSHVPQVLALEGELADVIIRVLDLAAAYNLNVANALVLKAEYNKSRPYKHGKVM